MKEQRLGILGGMGRPTRLVPCGDPGLFICPGQVNCPGIKVLASGQNAWDAAFAAVGPMPALHRGWPYE